MNKRRIFVADAEDRNGLAVVRSLAGGGFDPVAGVTNLRALAWYSRFISRSNFVVLPDPLKDPLAYTDSVISWAKLRMCVAVMPVSDRALIALDKGSARWPPELSLAGPKFPSIEKIIDKPANLRIATALGIPTPTEIEAARAEDLKIAVSRHPFPWVFKLPHRGSQIAAEVGLSVEKIYNLEQAVARFEFLLSRGLKPVIQEYFAGNLLNICCFRTESGLVATHQHLSIRRNSHCGVLREISQANEAAKEYAGQMLEAVDWIGLACVQFLISPQGELRYLETNGRFWASIQGSINAGWNYPVWLAEYCLDGVIPVPTALKTGSKTCSHADDLELLLNFLWNGVSPSLDHTPTKVRAIYNYLRAFGPGVMPDVFRWDDPLPSIVQHMGLAKRLLGRMISKISTKVKN